MPTKNTPPEQAEEKPPAPDEERRQVVQAYADDQREIIKKLRKVIGRLSRFGTFGSSARDIAARRRAATGK